MRSPALRSCLALAATMFVATPLVARAQTAPAAVERHAALTLRNALRLADVQAPDRLVAATRAAVAHADVDVAGMLTNPTVTVGSAAASAHFYTAIYVPVPLFGQRGAGIDVARALETAAHRDVDVTRLDVALGASNAWIDLWLMAHEIEIARRIAERSAQLAHAAHERFDAGAAPRLDTVRADAEALRLQTEADATVLASGAASARLALWIGTAADAALSADPDDHPAQTALPALPTLLARVDLHPLVSAARARTVAAESTVELERRRRLPTVGFEVGAGLFDPSMANYGSNGTPTFGDAHIALSFEVPMFNAHGPLIARARSAVAQSMGELQSVRRRLASDLAASYAEARAARLRATALREGVLPAAREAADLAMEAYSAGRLDLQGVLSAAQSFADAQRNAYRAEADAGRAYAALVHAAGGTW